MSLITVRVPRELKEKMKELDINWSEEIRKFIARRVDEELRKRRIEEALAMLKGTGSVERGFAERAVIVVDASSLAKVVLLEEGCPYR